MKLFSVYMIIFLSLVCGFLTFAASQEEYVIYNRAQGYFQQGRELGDEDLVKSAKGELLSFISKYPNSDLYVDALILLGDVDYYLNAYDDSESAYNRALSKLKPTDERYSYVLYSLAWTQYKAKKIELARDNLEKLSRISSVYQPNAFFLMGMIYLDAKDYDNAATYFKSAADVAKGELLAQSLYNYAYCMMKKGENEVAIDYFEKAATASSAPVISGKAFYQAALLLSEKSLSTAESFLKKAVGLLKGTENEKDALFFLGNILSEAKRYVEAISTYEKILSLNIDDEYKAKVYYEIGWNYYDMGEKHYLDSALAFSKAFELKSSIWSDAGFQLAYVYVLQGMYEKAREVYERLASGLTGSPLKYQALIEKGRMEIKLGNYDEAINTLSVVSKASEAKYALEGDYWLALAYYSTKRYRDSTSLLDHILSSKYASDELKARTYYLYGEIYFANKKYDKAIEEYMNVVDLGVRDVIDNAYYSIAISYYAQHKFDDARKYFSIVLNRYPKSETLLDTYYYLSEIARVQGDIATAFKYYDKILSIDKDKIYFYDVLVKKAEMLFAAKKFDELKDYAIKTIKAYPKSPKVEWLKYYLGEAYLNLHDYEDAYNQMTSLLKTAKTSDVKSGALYGIARYYAVKGYSSKAEEYYKTLLSNYPLSVKAPWASLDLALLYYNRNMLRDAKMMFFKTIFTYPDFEKNDACYFYIAQIYEKEKAYDKAIRTYQELIKKFPNSPKVPKAQKRIDELRK